MLFIPPGRNELRVLAIDPGTNTLGVSILGINVITKKISLHLAYTFTAERSLPYCGEFVDAHGELIAKLRILEDAIYDLLVTYEIDLVVSESPYLGRFPQAFAALTRCMCTIRQAMFRYDAYMQLFTIDPATVKMGVGVSGKSSDKNLMRNAILGMHDLTNPYHICLEILDEHSIDAIGVGIGYCRMLLQSRNIV